MKYDLSLKNVSADEVVSCKEDRPEIFVEKQDGKMEKFEPSKLKSRIQSACFDLDMNFVNLTEVMKKVKDGLTAKVASKDLDVLLAEVCASMTTKHTDYALLAGRIAVTKLHKKTKSKYSDVVKGLYNYINTQTGEHQPLVSESLYNVVSQNAEEIDSVMNYELDYNLTYFGFKTLEKSYLLKIENEIVERPQSMFMRVALAIHGDNLDDAFETYKLMSEKHFIHASPTLFNAGTPNANLCSCYIHPVKEDSVDGIFDTVKRCALISRGASGLGLGVHSVRSAGSYIKGIHGVSNGLVPMLKLFNDTARFISQGGNKRPAAFSVYLEPWHADIFDFLNLKKNNGKEEQRARDMFYGLWVPDLFMKRVENNDEWTLMSPDVCPGLHLLWGEEFEKLYTKYESQGLGRQTIKAQKLWEEICNAQTETGMPYLMYKDSCNFKSNQKHLGTITTSNPCAEILQFSSPDEVATCNVASIALNQCVTNESTFDFEKLEYVTSVLVKNLNKIIDVNHYPLKEAQVNALRHRTMAVGVQGLADVFLLMKMPFGSPESKQLNKDIFETIYYSALRTSCQLAQKDGPHASFHGSPASKGILQMDLWKLEPSERYDWKQLKEDIVNHGLRNSQLIGLMPTSSTSQIFGNCECFEPYTANLFTRRVYSGEYQVVNPHLVRQLVELDMWNESMRMQLLAHNGSVQNINGIPDLLKERFKTVWEISQKVIIDMAADRSPYVDQSQSMNLFLAEPTYEKLCSMHFYAWKKGLKTGSYYLRMKPAVNAIQFTVDKTKLPMKMQSTK